jgi:hypothetical protein
MKCKNAMRDVCVYFIFNVVDLNAKEIMSNKKVGLWHVGTAARVAYVPVVAHAVGVGVQARSRVASGVCGRIAAGAAIVHSLGLSLEGIARA